MDDDERSYASIGSAASGIDASALPRKDPGVDYMRLDEHHCRGPELLGSTRMVCYRVLEKCRKKGHKDLRDNEHYPTGCYRVLRGSKNPKLFKGFLADTLLSPAEEEALETERARANQEAYKQHQATLALGAVNLADDPRSESSDHTSTRNTNGEEPEELYSDFDKQLKDAFLSGEEPQDTATMGVTLATGAAYQHAVPKVTQGKTSSSLKPASYTRDELVQELHHLCQEMADLRKGRTIHSYPSKKAPPTSGPHASNPSPPSASSCPYFQVNRILPTKFYVVMKGRVPADNGIYHTWAIAGKKVIGVSGALHQSFKTYREAFEYWWHGTQQLVASGELPGRVPQPPPVGLDGGPGGDWMPVTEGGWRFFPPSTQAPSSARATESQPRFVPQPSSGDRPNYHGQAGIQPVSAPQAPSFPSSQATQLPVPGPNHHSAPSPGTGYTGQYPQGHPSTTPLTFPWGPPPPPMSQPTYGHVAPMPSHTPSVMGYNYPYPPPASAFPGHPTPSYSMGGYGIGGGGNPGGTVNPHAITSRFRGPDSSSGREGEVFGIKAQEEHAMLEAFAPGLSYEAQNRIALQMLDAVGLPGTSTTTSEEHSLSRLAEGLQTLATGRLSSPLMGQLGTSMDTGWKQTTRNTIGKLKTQSSLQEQVLTLTSSKEEVLSNVLTNIGLAYVAVGYPHDLAQTLARESMFYRISRENLDGYLHLHLHLLTRSVELGFAEVKGELDYHSKKLLDIRALQPTRFKMIVHHYIYFRDGQKKRWHSFGLQDLYMRSMRALYQGGGEEAPATGGTGRPCGHCHSRLHKGGKNKCYWKDLTPNEAKKAAASTAQNLGTNIVGVDE